MIIDAATEAFEVLLSPASLGLVLVGTVVGMLVGALPGLGAAAGVALLLPLTYTWQPESAFLLISAAIGGTTFAGSITAILIRAPGEASNAATLLDGYPLARQGKASLAISISAFSSALGAIFGLLVLVAVLPFGRDIIMQFSYPETFMVAVVGLFLIALVSEGSLLKGLIAGGLGFTLGMVGRDLVTGVPRFTFGSTFLSDGISFVAVLIGIFAVSEAIYLLVRPVGAITQQKLESRRHWSQVREGARVALTNPRLLMQSSAIGTLSGAIPGVGGSLAGFFSYAAAKSTSRDPSRYGDGDPRGVLAPEAANDAKDGGALIPTLAFGLPGSAVWAVVLGAFIIHGIAPGLDMLTTNLQIVFVIVYGLLLANVLSSLLGLLTSRILAPVAQLPAVYVAPVVFAVSLIGAYTLHAQRGDIVIALLAGIFGYVLRKHGFPLVPVVLALFLGSIVENSLAQTLLTGGPADFVTRPVPVAFILVALVLFLVPIVRGFRSARRNRAAAEEAEMLR